MGSYTGYRGERRQGGAIAGIVLAVLVGAVALGVFVHHARSGFAGKLASLITGRQVNVLSAPTVVERIQALSRMETVMYSLDTVVEGDSSIPLLPDAIAGDKLLLIVHGQTIAGVDLSKLKPEDVQINDNGATRSVQVTLPASEVFVTTLDNAHTRVYERTTGLFVHADPNLETLTRQKAQTQLQEAALQDGILDAARKNARAQLTTLLQGLGFAKVDVR